MEPVVRTSRLNRAVGTLVTRGALVAAGRPLALLKRGSFATPSPQFVPAGGLA